MQAELSSGALRQEGRSARLVKVRDCFIQRAVLGVSYRPAAMAAFLGCHASNISWALQKESGSS